MSKEEVKKEQDPKTKEPSYELPKTEFFEKGNIRKFAEHYGLFDGELGSPGKPPLKDAPKPSAKDDEDCPGCPPKTDKKAAAKEPEKVERKPIRVLKVDGKDVPVYTEEELNNLAQMGVDYNTKRQKDKAWEKDLQGHEDRLAKLAAPLMRLAEIAEKGGRLPGVAQEAEEQTPDEDVDESLIDPAVKKILDDQKAQIKALVARDSEREGERNVAQAQKATQAIDQIVIKSREEFPFTQEIKDGEDNIIETLFAGTVVATVNKEAIQKKLDPNFSQRPLPEVIRDSARRMNVVEHYYAKKYGETAKVTLEALKKDNPDLYREIGEDYVAAQKKETGNLPPRVQATNREVSPKAVTGQKTDRPVTSKDAIRDAISQGLADPEVQAGLQEIGQMKKYGLK
jgi:hypothetical protein